MDHFYAPGRNHLFVPGPVNIPEPVIRAMNRNNEDYRSPAIPALTKTLLEDVKKIFKTTTGTPFMIPTTGEAFINMVIAFIVCLLVCTIFRLTGEMSISFVRLTPFLFC